MERELTNRQESLLSLLVAIGVAASIGILANLLSLLHPPTWLATVALGVLFLLAWGTLFLFQKTLLLPEHFTVTLLLASFCALLLSIIVSLSYNISLFVPFVLSEPVFYYFLRGKISGGVVVPLLLSLFFIPFLLPILG